MFFFSGSLEEFFFFTWLKRSVEKVAQRIGRPEFVKIVEAAHLMKEWLRRGYTVPQTWRDLFGHQRLGC